MTHSFRTSRNIAAVDPSKPHLVLVGLPGSGKSTVGAAVAEKLGRGFLDFDVEIARREGMSISDIFGQKGEAMFRQLERQVTEELKDLGNMVLAPGGGWVGDPAVVALIRPPAFQIYLRVRPETALKRLGGGSAGRPLLNRPDPLAELTKLFESRRAAYQASDLEIGTENLTVEQVTEQILAKLATG